MKWGDCLVPWETPRMALKAELTCDCHKAEMILSCSQDGVVVVVSTESRGRAQWLPLRRPEVFGERSHSETSTCILLCSHDSSPPASSPNMNYSLSTVTRSRSERKSGGVSEYGIEWVIQCTEIGVKCVEGYTRGSTWPNLADRQGQLKLGQSDSMTLWISNI